MPSSPASKLFMKTLKGTGPKMEPCRTQLVCENYSLKCPAVQEQDSDAQVVIQCADLLSLVWLPCHEVSHSRESISSGRSQDCGGDFAGSSSVSWGRNLSEEHKEKDTSGQFSVFMFGSMPWSGQKKKNSEHFNLWAKQKVPLIKI